MNENPSRTPSDAHPTSQQKRHSVWSALKNGGPEGTRTPDLLRVKQALYQLSYRSEIEISLTRTILILAKI